MFKQTFKFCLIAFFVAVFSSISLVLLAQEQTQTPEECAPTHIPLSVVELPIAKLAPSHWQPTSQNSLSGSFATAAMQNVVSRLFWQSLNYTKLLHNDKHQYQHNINNWFSHQLSIKQQLNAVLNTTIYFYSHQYSNESHETQYFA